MSGDPFGEVTGSRAKRPEAVSCRAGCAAAAAGCSSESQGQPADVIEAFYDAANKGNYEEARQYLSETVLGNLASPDAAKAGGLKGVLDKYTRNGTLVDVEVGEVTLDDDGASCTVRKRFQDGSTKEFPVLLVDEDGQWKISWRDAKPKLLAPISTP